MDDAKTILFPKLTEETLKGEEIYKKSHHSYLPGEQKKRGYVFQEDARFGMKSETMALNGASVGVAEVLGATSNQEAKNLINPIAVSFSPILTLLVFLLFLIANNNYSYDYHIINKGGGIPGYGRSTWQISKPRNDECSTAT